MIKKNLLISLLFAPFLAYSDPTPFGLEIGKSTIDDVKNKYSTEDIGVNKYSNGEMYDIDVSDIKFDGLQKATVIFSQDGKLLAVLTTLSKEKFDYLLNNLSQKYKLISKKVLFVGDKSAKFIDGNTDITLDAPHMSFTMDMNYINKDLWKSYKNKSSNEQKEKEQAERSQL